MSTQTERPVRRPNNNKAAKSSRRYHKQTAHVEARRDGKPLIFGWGKHLSHTEKVRVQRRATWGAAAFIVLLLVVVLVGAWINFNIVVPGLSIASVNGHDIPQSQYRKMIAVKTQLEVNKLYGPNGLTNQLTSLQKQDAQQNAVITQTTKQISDLTNQLKKLPAGPSAQRTDLNNQVTAATKKQKDAQTQHQKLQAEINNLNNTTIPLERTNFTQAQFSNDSATWLQDDELIREWLATQNVALQNKINPSASQINRDFNSLKRDMPQNNGYNTFLSQMGISDDDIRSMLTIIDRRTNLQNYLAPTVASPSYQVLAREITVPTQQSASKILQDLQKGQDFGKLAKAQSKDTNTSAKGGDLGWLTRYQYIDASVGPGGPAVVENWIFDPARKLNEISPVLYGNGTYFIVQITNVDPARVVDANTLKTLKSNVLVDWLQDRGGSGRPLPGQNIKTPDQNMMADPNNLPPNNILPSAAPNFQQPGSSGLPPQQ
ncbi:MAG TPA: peptidylprolyl isomerase [Ktedonobacteraceae bacterium]|nr:peptidylprolyl isomerase [Ktedonobacteraceae bacterium]